MRDGVEYAINDSWNAGIIILNAPIGLRKISFTSCLNEQISTFEAHSHWQVRLGLNYRFGGPVGPVVAKY